MYFIDTALRLSDMLFTPHIKRKRRDSAKWNVQPFATSHRHCGLYDGTFTGISVEISDEHAMADVFNNGYYGKGTHSRSAPNRLHSESDESVPAGFKETLSLSLEEAFFLSFYLKVLRIRDIHGGELIWQDFLTHALRLNDRFLESLASYLYLKSKGWVVKSGLKFAGNFLVYRKGPTFYHASFVVAIVSNSDRLQSNSVKGLQRIAETSDKDVLLLEVNRPENYRMSAIEDIMQFKISESIIKRFNYTSFVQQQTNLIK